MWPPINRRSSLAQLLCLPGKLLEITAATRRILLEKVKALVQVLIFQIIKGLGFRIAWRDLCQDVKATELMPSHVLQAVLKDFFPDCGLLAHEVWPAQAAKDNILDK